MKCENCGFISSKDFYRCPYCGQVHTSDNFLDKSITFSNNFSMRIRTIFYIVLFNLLGAALLVDWYLSFKYGVTLFAYILFMGIFVFLNLFSKKPSPSTIVVRIDTYILLGLLLAWCYLPVENFSKVVTYVPTFALPGFIILDTLITAFVLMFSKTSKRIRPVWFEFNLFFHLAIITVLFIFFLVCKNNLGNASNPFYFMAFGSTKENVSDLFLVEEIVIFISFGLSLLYIVNYNIILVWNIIHKVTGYYGKPRD